LEQHIQLLKDAGADEIVAEAKKQLDEFKG
jgi:hypothetical protein